MYPASCVLGIATKCLGRVMVMAGGRYMHADFSSFWDIFWFYIAWSWKDIDTTTYLHKV